MHSTRLRRREVLGAAAGAAAIGVSAPAIARAFAGLDHLSPEFGALPLLDEKQAGHLRHIRNLADLPPGDWTHMQGDDPENTGDWTGYRFQLLAMQQVQAMAHRHLLPAAGGFFKQDAAALTRKMLRPETWQYWLDLSRSGPKYDPTLTGPRKGWWDPVAKENIFYSGVLLESVALFGYLFDDDRYDRMGSIAFEAGHRDMWTDKGRVEYNAQSLSDVIFWQMVENGYLGVACQPNWVFACCNMAPLRGFRYHDARKGTDRAGEVAAKLRSAWERYEGFGDIMKFPLGTTVVQKTPINSPGWQLAAWWMSGPYPDYFAQQYPTLIKTFARQTPAGNWEAPFYPSYLAMNAAERGDQAITRSLLRYVDEQASPRWENGGYFYPRHDAERTGAAFIPGVAPHMQVLEGNAIWADARLRAPFGAKTLYHDLWGRTHFEEPTLADLSRDLDVLRASYLPDRNTLVVVVRPMRGLERSPGRIAFANTRRQGQAWTMVVDGREVGRGGEVVASGQVRMEGNLLVFEAPVSKLTEIVLRWT